MTRRPRVAVVVPDLPGGGGVTAVARFLVEAAEASERFDLTLVSLATASTDDASRRLRQPRSWRRGPVSRPETWEGRTIAHVGASLVELEFQRYRSRRVLSETLRGSDLIQVVAGAPSWALPVVGMGIPVSLQVATRVKVERRIRDSRPDSIAALWRRTMTGVASRFEIKSLRSVDAVQVENAWMLDEVRSVNSGRPDVDIRLAPPGVDSGLFVPGLGTSAGVRYILSVGRFDDPRKNVGLLLKAFGEIAADFPAVRLITAGASRPPTSYFSSAVDRGLADRVTHVDGPSREDLVALYQGAEVFALASDEEGLGIVLLEAMACGVPVVSTRSGGPDSLITDGHDGFLVPRGDGRMLAARLRSLLSDPGQGGEMGRAARKTVEKRYAADVAAQQFLDVWDALI